MSLRVDGKPRHTADQESVGALVSQATDQLSQLVRQEMRLAQVEMQQKGKRFGMGGGLFGGAGLFGFLALQAGVATAIAALALVLPVWASCLIVFGALLVLAGIMALMGKQQIGRATPAAPQRTIDNVKADVAALKERSHR